MQMRGVSVKVLDVNKNFIAYKYINSNARSRVRRMDFIKDFQEGILDVINPEMLNKD